MNKLAIEGGRPVRTDMLPYGRQELDEVDIQAVGNVLRSKWITTGPAVAAFEEAFAAQVGAKYAVAVSSGTAALHAAAFAAGLETGDEAIVPAITFVATANCVRYLGGNVVFADVQDGTLNVDPQQVQARCSSRTRAIIAVDYSGQPADLEEVAAIADKSGLVFIEDASHALGATYRGRRVGEVAHLTTFSLHPVKHITTGEGGMVTTNDPRLAKRLRLFRNHGIAEDHHQRGRVNSWTYEMVELGYNYRLTDFQSALGLTQLKKSADWTIRRRDIAARYAAAFVSLPEIEIPQVLSDRESAWHLYVIRLNLTRLRVGRGDIFKALRAENIGVNVHYIPVPWHPYYQKLGYSRGQWPIAEHAYERILSLPIFPAMTEKDIDDTIVAVTKVIEAYRK